MKTRCCALVAVLALSLLVCTGQAELSDTAGAIVVAGYLDAAAAAAVEHHNARAVWLALYLQHVMLDSLFHQT